MTVRHLLMILAVLPLSGCGQSAQENTAQQLDNAAAQSDPAAAEILHNAADDIREDDSVNATAEAQNALQAAGNAQTGATAPNRQAAPHRAGEPTPPPKSE